MSTRVTISIPDATTASYFMSDIEMKLFREGWVGKGAQRQGYMGMGEAATTASSFDIEMKLMREGGEETVFHGTGVGRSGQSSHPGCGGESISGCT
jgi:hypothetical protein